MSLSPASTLAGLLDAGAAFDAEYGTPPLDRLADHRPMALAALARLGAAPARLEAFAAAYETKLRPARPPEPWPAGDAWAGRLGDAAAWPAYRHLFHAWLVDEGAASVLEQVLPRLCEGAGGAAFHGLIRTAYAVQAGHGREIADALAHWAAVWMPLLPVAVPAEAPAGRSVDPARALAVLPPTRRRAPGALIADRMAWVARRRGFAALVDSLAIDARTLERLARHAAGLYARTGDFTVLHLTTSAHALRVLMPFVREASADEAGARSAEAAALRGYWAAYAAGVAATPVAPGRAPAAWPWSDLVGVALANDDEHVVKLIDTCREQEAAYGGEVWARAATRAAVEAVGAGAGR
jgi:hypothetical protein